MCITYAYILVYIIKKQDNYLIIIIDIKNYFRYLIHQWQPYKYFKIYFHYINFNIIENVWNLGSYAVIKLRKRPMVGLCEGFSSIKED